MYEFDEPYYEPTEADKILLEYVEKMKGALSKEFKARRETIEKENLRLVEENINLKALVGETSKRERELESQKKTLESDIKRKRLQELFQDFEHNLYKPNNSRKNKPKCNKCDDKRKLCFTSPSGKDMAENCECSNRDDFYTVSEYHCTEFILPERNYSGEELKGVTAWYKESDPDYDGYQSSMALRDMDIFKEGLFEEETENTYFRTKEDCQRYCDWLNSKTGGQ